MLTWDVFKHYLFSRRAGALIRIVAWICIAGVGVGVMSLVVVLSIMNGFNDSIRRRLLAVEPHLVVKIPGAESFSDVQAHPAHAWLKQQPGVTAHLFENQDVIIRTVDGFFGGGVARGVDADSLHAMLSEVRKASQPEREASGTLVEVAPTAEETANLGPGEVLMGVNLARSLGIFEGDRVTLVAPEALLLPSGEMPSFERVLVKGLLATNIDDIDSKVLFYGRSHALTYLRDSASKEVAIEVRLPNPNDYSAIKSALEKQGAVVETWKQRNSLLFHALRMEKIVMGMFLTLTALIASFSLITVLVLLLTQKRKDIGVFMAMGLSPRRTRRLFMRVGLILSSIGIGGGLFLGILISLLIDRYPIPILPDIYYDSTIPATLDPVMLFWIIFFAGLIAFLAAWLPARHHTQLLPAEALRGRLQERAVTDE